MKNLLIGLFVFGLTSLTIAQNSRVNSVNSEMKGITATSFNEDLTVYPLNESANVFLLNIDYVNNVLEETMSDNVRKLEYKVSNYDVYQSSKFDGRLDPFKVIFKNTKGLIVVAYNNNGKILSTIERFNNVKLPRVVTKSVLTAYPNWKLNKNSYHVTYSINKGAKKVYKVQLSHGNFKKTLKIDSKGNIM